MGYQKAGRNSLGWVSFALALALLLGWLIPQGRASDLVSLREQGVLVVAVKDNWRPLGFRDQEGRLQGFEIDIAQHLAVELIGSGATAKLVPIRNVDRLSAVANGQVDLAIAGITATKSRARLVQFSPAYYLDGTMLATISPLVQTLKDLGSGPIVALQHSDAIPVIKQRLPRVRLVAANSYAEALAAVVSNRAIAIASDASVLAGLIQENPNFRLLPERLSTHPLSVAMPKGVQHKELYQQVQQSLRRWQVDGWLQQRTEAWGLP